jgi:hypothetical protein
MKSKTRNFGASRSGQLLIVAALAVAIIISSTTLYVYDVSRQTGTANSQSLSELILALKQASRNTLVSSLANTSRGGNEAILNTNLNELQRTSRLINRFGLAELSFTLLNASGYSSGISLAWNTSIVDVSSAYANFTLNVIGLESKVTTQYAINITTSVQVNGSYSLVGIEKHVNLTCRIYNEDEPALTRSIALFYANLGNWTRVDETNSLAMVNRGDGVYDISFIVPSTTTEISINCLDLRDILVQSTYFTP